MSCLLQRGVTKGGNEVIYSEVALILNFAGLTDEGGLN